MKIKHLILCLFMFSLCGCFNYVEINNLVIVSGIGIDYKNEEYIVTFEALYQNKKNGDTNFESGNIKTGSGKTITDAFNNLTLSLEKEPYFAHLKVVVISSSVAESHLNELFDFFLRNNNIRNIFSLVITTKNSPEEILNLQDDYFPVVSERIKTLLENNVYSNYISKNKYFKEIASNYLSKKKNITLSDINIKDGKLSLNGIVTFDEKKPVGYLNENLSLNLSLIDNKKPNASYKIKCSENLYTVINIYKSKTNIKINKNIFEINNTLDAEIIENSCNIDIENNDNQKKLEHDFKIKLDKEITNLIAYLKSINSDIIGINNKYYIKYRNNNNNNYFKNTNFKVKNTININKKGLIFEVDTK